MAAFCCGARAPHVRRTGVLAQPFELVRWTPQRATDVRLQLYHNTRHASPHHSRLRGLQGWQLRSPWLSRFDWVLDAHLEAEPSERPIRICLTQQRVTPRSVFIKAGLLPLFVAHVLPDLEQAVTLYVGNANLPLSAQIEAMQAACKHPLVHAVFCENKDLDVPAITAMPIGLHPATLLRDDGGVRLQGMASEVDLEAKLATVLRPCGAVAALLGYDAEPPEIEAALASDFGTDKGPSAYWPALARHRFVILPWSLHRDTPAPFEALVLGTIPILQAGPLAEAYRGLPVVIVDDPREITRANLDRWWDQHLGALAHRAFTAPEHWWAKVAAALPRRKRAFLVLGPESHGTHLVADLLVRAGCHGHSGDHGSWRAGFRETSHDRQPWDDALPTDEDPIVWRRSVPHLKNWPDIRGMIASLETRGYAVRAIVTHRERYAAIQSQLRWRHVPDAATGRANIERAYPYIFGQLQASAVPVSLVGYEALVTYPEAQDHLLADLGLALPPERLETWDGNRPSYDAAPVRDRGWPASTAAAAGPASDFPEWWFTCDPAAWEAYEQRVARGRTRMQVATAVFCGLARDVAGALPSVSARIERAGSMFRDYRIVIYENDSSDETLVALRAWQDRNPRVTVLSEVLGAVRWGQVRDPARMRHLAACRNRYLDHVAVHHADFDYLVVFDTDLPKGFSYDGLADTFGHDEWHVVGSNSLLVPIDERPPPNPEFFDAWAFRQAGDDSPRPFGETNHLVFRRGEPLVPVWSAFGGLAIYVMAAVRSGARYAGDDCEHVTLHRRLRERGFDRQYLNPSQIVLYAGGA
jgi:hypothetical protein